ncbi:MAG: L-threonylcarbamoyladenylate synthase [Candidatus Aminicenantes bacterium]|nr:L-threonylcarbamoyladenylate synthase [Candidatus Aminicenantes bacterium]
MIVIPFSDIHSAANFSSFRDCFLHDGVIAYPTDTLYGLGGNFYSLAVSAKIDRLKNRNDQPYSVAVGSMAMLESLAADIAEVFYLRLQKLLPGKFTFLFTANPAIDRRLLKNCAKIGIRLPGLPGLLQLIQEINLPLISTSVNRSGQPPLNDPARIAVEFPGIDLLIDGGVLPPSLGSTVVDVSTTPPEIIRPGADLDELLSVLGRGDIV